MTETSAETEPILVQPVRASPHLTSVADVRQRINSLDNNVFARKMQRMRMNAAVRRIQLQWRRVRQPALAMQRTVVDPLPWPQRLVMGWAELGINVCVYAILAAIFCLEVDDLTLLSPKPRVGASINFAMPALGCVVALFLLYIWTTVLPAVAILSRSDLPNVSLAAAELSVRRFFPSELLIVALNSPVAVWILQRQLFEFEAERLSPVVGAILIVAMVAQFLMSILLLQNVRGALVVRHGRGSPHLCARLRRYVAVAMMWCMALLGYLTVLATSEVTMLPDVEHNAAATCALVNQSYISLHCQPAPAYTAPGRPNARFPEALVCVDGGHGAYSSAWNACYAALAFPDFLSRSISAITLMHAGLCVLVCVLLRESGWDDVPISRGARIVAQGAVMVVTLCAAMCIGVVFAPAQSAAVSLDVVQRLIAAYLVAWTLVFVAINEHYLRLRLQRILSWQHESHDAFLSHAWSNDSLDRSNHVRVLEVAMRLRHAGLDVWIDEERMRDDIVSAMSRGIDRSTAVVAFVTSAYLAKAGGFGPLGANDNWCVTDTADNPRRPLTLTMPQHICVHACARSKAEFDYACLRKGVEALVPVVMEPAVQRTTSWQGAVGMKLGNRLYIDLSADVGTDAFEAGCARLVESIQRMVRERRAGVGTPSRRRFTNAPMPAPAIAAQEAFAQPQGRAANGSI